MTTLSATYASRYPISPEGDTVTNADAERFQDVYREHLAPIYRYVYAWVKNREEAEDLTAEIFLKAVRGVDYRRKPQEIQRWLYQVARTTINDHWRARQHIFTCSLEALLNTDWEDVAQEESIAKDCKRTDRVQLLLSRLSTGSPEELLDAHWESTVAEEPTTAMNRSAERVERLFQALPRQYGEVLTCRFLLNLSVRETAHKMGVTISNVKVLQFRALKRAAELESIVTD